MDRAREQAVGGQHREAFADRFVRRNLVGVDDGGGSAGIDSLQVGGGRGAHGVETEQEIGGAVADAVRFLNGLLGDC